MPFRCTWDAMLYQGVHNQRGVNRGSLRPNQTLATTCFDTRAWALGLLSSLPGSRTPRAGQGRPAHAEEQR